MASSSRVTRSASNIRDAMKNKVAELDTRKRENIKISKKQKKKAREMDVQEGVVTDAEVHMEEDQTRTDAQDAATEENPGAIPVNLGVKPKVLPGDNEYVARRMECCISLWGLIGGLAQACGVHKRMDAMPVDFMHELITSTLANFAPTNLSGKDIHINYTKSKQPTKLVHTDFNALRARILYNAAGLADGKTKVAGEMNFQASIDEVTEKKSTDWKQIRLQFRVYAKKVQATKTMTLGEAAEVYETVLARLPDDSHRKSFWKELAFHHRQWDCVTAILTGSNSTNLRDFGEGESKGKRVRLNPSNPSINTGINLPNPVRRLIASGYLGTGTMHIDMFNEWKTVSNGKREGTNTAKLFASKSWQKKKIDVLKRLDHASESALFSENGAPNEVPNVQSWLSVKTVELGGSNLARMQLVPLSHLAFARDWYKSNKLIAWNGVKLIFNPSKYGKLPWVEVYSAVSMGVQDLPLEILSEMGLLVTTKAGWDYTVGPALIKEETGLSKMLQQNMKQGVAKGQTYGSSYGAQHCTQADYADAVQKVSAYSRNGTWGDSRAENARLRVMRSTPFKLEDLNAQESEVPFPAKPTYLLTTAEYNEV